MKRNLLALCLLVPLLLTACVPSQPGKNNGAGSVPDKERTIKLHSVEVQEKQLNAVFENFSGVTSYAFSHSQRQLGYKEDGMLWTTDLNGLHQPQQDTAFATWYEATAKDEALRFASDRLPNYFPSVDGDNIRCDPRGRFAAYRQVIDGKYNLILSNPIGQKHIILSQAESLALLGWHDDMKLVFAAAWPELPTNIYVIDLQAEFVELNDVHNDTFTPPAFSLSDLKLGPDLRTIWKYDEEQLAYQMGSAVYVQNLVTGNKHELANIGHADVIWAAGDLFVSARDKNSEATLWYRGQNKPLSGQRYFEPDWVNSKLYYLSLPEEQNSIYVTDLNSLQETQIASTEPGRLISGFSQSPDNKRLLYIEGKSTYDLGEKVNETAFVIDLAAKNKQEISGLSKENSVRHEQVVWIRENLIALGYIGLWASENSQTLDFYTLSDNEIALTRTTRLNSGLFTPDGKGIFLSDFDHSDGYDPSFKANIWHYDTAKDTLQQVTQKAEWQIQQDIHLTYNPTRQLLFISRFRGHTQANYTGQLRHGVLVDQQRREFTLLKLREEDILQALWIGDRLLVRTTDRVLVYDFAE
jgi:hypothetical protein